MEVELGSLGPISPSEEVPSEFVTGDGNAELRTLLPGVGDNGSNNESYLEEVVTEDTVESDIERLLKRLQPQVTTGDPLSDALYKAVVRNDPAAIANLIKLPNDIKKPFADLMRGDPYLWDFDEINIWRNSSVEKQTYDVNRVVPIHTSDLTVCDVEFRGNETWSLLHLASSYAEEDSLCLLLVAGANLHARDSLGRSILDVCASNLHKLKQTNWRNLSLIQQTSKFIKNLISARVQFDMAAFPRKDKLYYTLVLSEMIRTRRQKMDDVKRLLDAGAMDDPTDYACWDTIRTIVVSHAKEELQMVLDHNDVYANVALQHSTRYKWLDGVRISLLNGASILEKTSQLKQKAEIRVNYKGYLPLHIAAKNGIPDILNLLLDVSKDGNDDMSRSFPDAPTSEEPRRLYFKKLRHYTESFDDIINHLDESNNAPIHYAVQYKRLECFDILIQNGATLTCLQTQTLLHLAVNQNDIQIAERIIALDSSVLKAIDEHKRQPLHIACELGHIDMIFFLVNQGADLSSRDEFNTTPIHIIKNKFTDPKALMVDIFDSNINCNHLENKNCYNLKCSVFNRNECDETRMDVVQTLVSTDQAELLTHPLIETYIYLEWKSIALLYYLILVVHFLFILFLNLYIVPRYYYQDKKEELPSYLNFTFSMCVIYSVYHVVTDIIALQEVYKLGYSAKTPWYILLQHTWMTLMVTVLYTTLPFVLFWESSVDSEGGRFLACLAVLYSIIELSIQISVIIDWGLYMLIIGKLIWKYFKILLLSGFPLILAFSLVFMIQMRSQESYEGLIPAISKSTIMINSEFDYGSFFNTTIASDFSAANLIPRGFLLMFIIILPIGFYNLMVEASNVDDVVKLSNIRRLEKQVDFIASTEKNVLKKYFKKKCLSNWREKAFMSSYYLCNGKRVHDIEILPDLPKHLKDAIVENVQSRTDELRRSAFSAFKVIARTRLGRNRYAARSE